MAKPDRISNLSLKREGNVIKASWKNPSNKGNSLDTRFWFDRAGVKPVEAEIWYANRGSEKPLTYTAADRFWSRGCERVGYPSSFDKNYDRNRFHPVTAGKTLAKVQVGVAGYNRGFAPWTWATYSFGKPRQPSISWDYKKETSVATVTVETNEGKDQYERYDTMILVKIRKQDGKEAVLMNWSSTKSTKWQKSWDLSGYTTNLQSGQWVSIRCWAYARGIAGDNPASNKPVYAERNICFPVASTPGTPTCDKKAQNGRIKVPVSRSGWWVTDQLQRKVGDGNWSDVSGATDNHEKNTISLYDSYGDVMPENGVYTYYRVKTTRDQFTSYSGQVTAKCIYTAKPAETCTATCKLLTLVSSSDGTQVTVKMGWKDSTANTGCELSWSKYGNGWNTTEAPSTTQLTGTTGTQDGWKYRTHVITGLTPGDTIYVRMRRYKTYASGNTVYSAYDIAGRATRVVTESASDDKCSILSADVTGTTAKLTIGINEDNQNEGTEITWADNADAWQSNEQPNSFNATWPRESNGGDASWPYKQIVYLRGLEAGKTYWIRARRYTSSTFSGYSATKQFSIPSGASRADYDPRCGLVSVEPGADGHSAKVVIGWSGDHTGCEASWSDNPDAWESSDGPSKFEYEWEDSENQSNGYFLTEDTEVVESKTYYTRSSSEPYVYTEVAEPALEDIGTYYEYGPLWSHTSTCYLNGLSEGVTYYVKARSYFDGDTKTYSGYTTDMSVTPYSAPESVVLDAPAAIARGKAIECWWEISGELEQTEWHMHDALYPMVAMDEGTGSLCHASIEPERYGDADTISLFVEAGCGGGLTRSNTVTVAIADVPECSASCSATLTAQPASFEVLSSDAGARLLATCYSRGCTLSAPDGDFDQLDGDAVWTQASTPTWNGVRWDATALYTSLSSAKTAADTAKGTAETAFQATAEYAVLNSYELTSDVSLVIGKTYYTRSGQGTEQSPYVYTEVESPVVADIATYYENTGKTGDLEAAGIALATAKSTLATAQAALVAAQAALAALTPEDEGYEAAVAAVEAAEDDVADAEDDLDDAQDAYDNAMTAYLAAFDAAYATDEGIALQDAEAAAEAATAALNAHQASDTVYSTTVTMPVSDLYDGGMYYAEFRTVENIAGLASEPAIAEFGVSYAHQAPEPSSLIAVTPNADERKVVINLAAPTGAATGDVYDIYRQTPAGYELIAYGKGTADEITDLYAPYGHADTAYRIACRTADGDISWSEFAYSMPVKVLRFDWDEESAEFPWNVELRESMGKDYENRRHVDGSMNGYWDRGVTVSGSYSTDIVKVEDAELLRQARMLGSYAGAVWVRDAHGKAMQCNVDVNEISIDYRTKAVGLSFSISAMKTTEQFMAMGTEETEEP